jgi:plastocyanin
LSPKKASEDRSARETVEFWTAVGYNSAPTFPPLFGKKAMFARTDKFYGRSILAALVIAVCFCGGSVPNSMAQDGYGGLSGQIFVDGKVPAPAKSDVNKDQAVCLADNNVIFDQSLLVGANNELQGAFVMLLLKPREEIKVHPDLKAPPTTEVVLDNNKCIFVPATLAVRTGQSIKLKNSDAAGHNCNVASFNNAINVNLPPNSETPVKFEKSDKVPAVVKCDIHPWMVAYILIRDDPYFAVTDAEGKFSIEKIPAGKWNFQFWHSRCGYMKDLQQGGKGIAGKRGEVEFEIKDGETLDLGKLMIEAKALAEKK